MKTIQKLLCIVLLAAMLLPCVTVLVTATEGTAGIEFENIYSAEAGRESKPNNTNGTTFYSDVAKIDYWYTTGVITVSAGDTITFGPYPERLQLGASLYLYSDDAAKTYIGRYLVHNSSIDCVVTGTIFGNLKIYTYTVPEDGTVGSIRLSFPKIYKDQFLVTRNYRFTADEYYNYMKTVEGKDVSFVPDVATGADLTAANLFTNDVKGIIRSDSTTEEGYTILSSDTAYYQFFEDVQAGDIFYFVAPDVLDLGLNLVTSFVDNKFLQLKASDLICIEKADGADSDGNPYAIFAYKVGSDVDKVAIMTKLPEGQRIVTKNLRFDRAMYLEFIGYEIPNLTNLYDSVGGQDRYLKSGGTSDTVSSGDGLATTFRNAYWHMVNTISVKPGEKITIGPFPQWFDGEDEHHSLVTYSSPNAGKSNYLGNYRLYQVAEVTDTIIGNMKIYTYTVPEGVKGIRFSLPQSIVYQYVNGVRMPRMLITKNYQFTGEEYFRYMKEVKGIDVKFADDVATLSDPKNELTAANKFGPTQKKLGYITSSGAEIKDEANTDAYYTLYKKENGDFVAGDTFYFVAPIATDNNGLSLVDVVFGNSTGDFATEFPLKAEELTLLEDLGNGRGVYSYTVSADVTKLSILGYNNVVPHNEQLITKNLRFSGEMYHDYIDGHNYTLKYGANSHWKECECGAIDAKTAHTFENYCDATCDVCGATRALSGPEPGDYILHGGTIQTTMTELCEVESYYIGNSNQDVVQGGCTDGTYLYMLINSGSDSATVSSTVYKYEIATGELIARYQGLKVCHGNDMTYVPDKNEIVFVHNKPQYQYISIYDADTMELKEKKDLGFQLYSIAYDLYEDCFWVGISGGYKFAKLDRSFNKVGTTFVGVDTGSVKQGLEVDSRYLYFIRHKANSIDVYDKSGAFIRTILLPDTYSEEPENISCVGDAFYIGYNTFGGEGGMVYKAEFSVIDDGSGQSNHIYDKACDADCNICGATRVIEHDYETKYDANYHWNECVCGGKTEPVGHTLEQKFGENGHWSICACGYESEVTAHDYDNDCDTDCNLCGEVRETSHIPGAAADCTTAQTCTVCGAELKVALGHTPGAEATCTTAQTCTVCGAELKVALGHTPGAEATCTTAQTCTVCGAELAEALGHTPGAAATCTTAQTCTVCRSELAAALGHTPGAAADCTTAQTCTVCEAELAAALGHTPGAEATCTTAQTCTVCRSELAAALGHTPGAAATCTTAQTCAVCGAELAEALGHTPGAAATCTTAQTCTVCGAELAEALGHTPGAAATCMTAQTCTVCRSELAAALGHTPGAAATCTKAQTCAVCGAELAEATGHNYETTKYNADGHWTECACGDKTEVNEHVYDDGEFDIACDCGYVVPGEFVQKEDGLYYLFDGKFNWTQAGLYEVDGDYYFVTSTGKCKTGIYYAWETHCDLPCGNYEFGEDGKMLRGLVEKADGVYYYVDGKIDWTQAGLHKIEGDYYFVTSAGKCKTGVYYAWETHCDLPCGNYEFGEDGKMLRGLVEKADGIYYYVNGKVPAAGLYEVDGDYYFVTTTGKCKTGVYYAWATYCDLPCGNYEFGEDGKMIR